MPAINKYSLASQLVKRIVRPSNQTGGDESTHTLQDFNPDKSYPVYNVDLSGPTLEYTHSILDDLYHTKYALDEYKPDDYRIGSVNELQADINQLGRLIVYDINLTDLLQSEFVTEEELEKALTVSIDYSGLSDIEFYYLYLYIHKYKFPEEAWSRLSGSGGLAEDDPELAEKVLAEVMKVQQRSLAASGAFTQWTHSFKHSIGESWLFERFLKQINGPVATGQPLKKEMPYFYKKFSPSMPEYKQRGITIHDFPGPGLVIYGLHSPMFPKNYLDERFTGILYAGGAAEGTDADYRISIVQGENETNKTIFAFFRGMTLIYNSEKMRINGEPYGLVVFNDHFPSDHINTAYLVHREIVGQFLRDPFSGVGKGNILHPRFLEHRPELRGKLIKLVSIAATAGFCEEVPGDSTNLGDRRRLHAEVKHASFFGLSQLDLVREAYRLYLLGHHYNRQRNNFYLDEFVMLKELLRINKQLNQSSAQAPLELPVAFPFTFFEHSVDDAMVRSTGFVGANMVVYKNSPKGDCMLFSGTIGDIDPKDIDTLPPEKIRELLGGNEEYDKWNGFREGCEYYPANPLIVDSVYKRIGSNIIQMSYNDK